MAYSVDVATLLTNQLSKFITLNRHQLAGQVANLEFWIDEVRHCLGVIDGYPRRFEQLKEAQAKYVAEHGTIDYLLEDEYLTTTSATPPRRVPHSELKEARRLLCDATYRLLIRGFNEGALTELMVRQTCRELGIGIEASDLRSRNTPPAGPGQLRPPKSRR